MARDDDDFDTPMDDDETPRDALHDKDDDDEEPSKPKDDEPGERARRAAKAARRERDDARRQLAEMRKEIAELKQGTGKADPKDDAARDREADERAHQRYRPLLIKASATAALVKAGAKPDRVTRLVRLLEADDINVDEKGDVDEDDLQAEVDRLKEDMPELFKGDDDDDRPAKRPTARRVDGAPRKSGGNPVSSSTARLAAQLTGRR